MDFNTFISICHQPPRSTQAGDYFMGERNEYQTNASDSLRLGSKVRYGPCVWQVKLCDPLVTNGQYLSV